MPDREGFGLKSRSFENSSTKCTFFLKRTDFDFIPRSNDYQPFDFRDLYGFVSSIDDELLVSGEGTSLLEEEFKE